MRTVVLRLLTLSAENVSAEVVIALAAVYLVLVMVSLASVFSLHASVLTKVVWSLFILILPVLGIACYCVWTLLNADFEFLKQFGLAGKKKLSHRL